VKRLKANSSQLNSTVKDFTDSKDIYLSYLTIPPMTTAAHRAQMLDNLQRLATRYDTLLDIRRQIIDASLTLLENSMDAPALKGSTAVGDAIDVQIAAAKDLATMQAERDLKKETEALKAPK
jgi:hypothetical protein